jgi:16S rRNA (guanine966-N2)-methyltransferase
MIERDRAVAQALRDSARSLDAPAQVIESDALAYLERAPERFDLAFVDPPFASDLAARALALLPRCLNEGSRVYVESGEPIEAGAPWERLREDRAGAVRYALYAYRP